jgi:hypothetical protein
VRIAIIVDIVGKECKSSTVRTAMESILLLIVLQLDEWAFT